MNHSPFNRIHVRAKARNAIRSYFDEQGFVEVDTPIAIRAPAPEPTIEAPSVCFKNVDGSALDYFLRPSPELAMKRVVAAGMPRIYQIGSAFRDGDVSPQHRPEFCMLEWYRQNETWDVLFEDCEALLHRVAHALFGKSVFVHNGTQHKLPTHFRRIDVDTAFRTHAGFSILDHLTDDSLRTQVHALGIHTQADDSWNDLFHRVFLTRVEPQLLASPEPLFLTHYPAPLASLARLSPSTPGTAERMELYCNGMELANGFGELSDSQEQRQRFEIDLQAREVQGMRTYPLDEHFLLALEEMGEAAGMALGFDRLLMALGGASNIDDVTTLPWMQ